MALMQCTQQLLAELAIPKFDVSKKDFQNPSKKLGNWHAKLTRIQRKKCVLFTHDLTLYSVFIPQLVKADFKRLKELFLEHLMRTLESDGLQQYKDLVLQEYQELHFVPTSNSRVLGSMNNMCILMDYFIDELDPRDILKINKRLNEIPFKPIGYDYPVERMRDLLQKQI